MSFVKRDVKDVVVQYPQRYELRDISTGAAVATYDFVPVTGEVSEAGTDVNRAYLMPIEEGLEDASAKADVAVPNTRTINEKALDADIILTPADVGAAPASHVTDADIHVTTGNKADWDNAYGLSKKNLVNSLRMQLQFTLATQNIDAWCDLFDDASQINAAASSGYSVSSGVLKTLSISQTTESYLDIIGRAVDKLSDKIKKIIQ